MNMIITDYVYVFMIKCMCFEYLKDSSSSTESLSMYIHL